MKILTTKEFCKAIKITRQTFQAWIHATDDNALKQAAFRIGKEWRVDLDKYLRLVQKKT